MKSLICFLVLFMGINACMKTIPGGGEIPGEPGEGPACTTCSPLTLVTTPCPVNYDCSNTGIEEPLTYSTNSRDCSTVACTVGQMFEAGQALPEVVCSDGSFSTVNGPVSQVACGLPCNACTQLTKNGLTCPPGHTCTSVSQREGQCPESYCPAGMMTADGVQVESLKCNTLGQWVYTDGIVYAAAQCELSCELCTTITNTGMPCPTGLICEPPTEREGTCKETYCPEGEMTGNTDRTALTLLTCSGGSEWIDGLDTVYTSAQCETRCDQCTALTKNGMTCPPGFICEDVTLQPGQCPNVACTEGTMKADPGMVEVTSLTCDGSSQWVDDQAAVYTSAHCEFPCTECPAPTNTGMDCPKGFICEPAETREGQCSEVFCSTGSLTANTERTPLTLLTCSTEAEWIDTQDVPYTLAQCETPCDQCSTPTNAGMTCLSGFVCTPVTVNTDGQCPVASCESGHMTAGDGRTTVPSLSCNGLAQWVDPQATVYTKAQCETGCLYCGDVNAGTGVTVKLEYNPTTWCKQYTLTGCPRGYRIGRTTITGVLTCDRFLRWTSGSYTGEAREANLVNASIVPDCQPIKRISGEKLLYMVHRIQKKNIEPSRRGVTGTTGKKNY
ncbi:hypothetical protein TELCIR_00142 [Teladorsagia circumcincta]|uniref:Uncharacterized protein n=1 Tax=Teladorsagia circumcincta TaxID=45464 RepID=A0A2G9V7K3_TELCI|nr:hypothetical protein TELCIR_00142 [Teladorsagia circumcincta]